MKPEISYNVSEKRPPDAEGLARALNFVHSALPKSKWLKGAVIIEADIASFDPAPALHRSGGTYVIIKGFSWTRRFQRVTRTLIASIYDSGVTELGYGEFLHPAH